MVISYYDQTETKMVVGLLAASKMILLIIVRQSSIFDKIENIVYIVCACIIYRPPNQIDIIDHFNSVKPSNGGHPK